MTERHRYSPARARLRFQGPRPQPSDLYKRAVAVLGELAVAEGLDEVGRAYGEVVSPRLIAQWCEDHVESGAVPNIERLRRRPSSPGQADVPGGDHNSSWGHKPSRKLAQIVTQPYGLDTQSILHIADRIRELDLSVSIGAGSWHFPGRTLLVVFGCPENAPL